MNILKRIFTRLLGRSMKSQDSLIEILENQMEDNHPPETKEVLEKLVAAGMERDVALDRMADVMEAEIITMTRENKAFNIDHYVEMLKSLV